MTCTVLVGVVAQDSAPAADPLPAPTTNESQLPFASTETDAPSGAATVGAFGVWDLVRMVVALVVVVAAVYGVVGLLRRRVDSGTETEGPIRILASQSLSGNRTIHAVRVGAKVYLIGAGDAAVNLIAGIRDQETIDELELAHSASRAASGRASFGALLSRWVANAAAAGLTGGASARGDSPLGTLQQQRERLRGIR